MSDFGKRLKKVRTARQITQKQLAEILGVAQSTVANYENNTRFPMEHTLVELSNYLNVSIDHLMGIKKIPKKPTNILPEVFLDYLMDGEEQKAVELIKESHKNGIPFTSIIKDTIIPMMDRVGSLWEKGELTPAQEHYLSNIVEGLIAYWSNSLPRQVKKDWSVLLMTPGLEEHVLTLQIAAEYFRSKSWNVYYIGKSVPFDGLSHLIETHSIHVVVLSITMEANLKSCQELIFNIRKLNAKNSPLIVVGGPAVKTRQFAVNTLGADIFVPKVTDLSSIVEKIEKSLLKGL